MSLRRSAIMEVNDWTLKIVQNVFSTRFPTYYRSLPIFYDYIINIMRFCLEKLNCVSAYWQHRTYLFVLGLQVVIKSCTQNLLMNDLKTCPIFKTFVLLIYLEIQKTRGKPVGNNLKKCKDCNSNSTRTH